MNIFGNGVDIVENKRIQKSLKNKNFLNRIFTRQEIINSKTITNKVNYFAKRFAAKEAFVKALGLGFRENINFIPTTTITDKLLGDSIASNMFIIGIAAAEAAVAIAIIINIYRNIQNIDVENIDQMKY